MCECVGRPKGVSKVLTSRSTHYRSSRSRGRPKGWAGCACTGLSGARHIHLTLPVSRSDYYYTVGHKNTPNVFLSQLLQYLTDSDRN